LQGSHERGAHQADLQPSAIPNQPLPFLQTVLTATTTFDVTDSKDRIYALLGLITNADTTLPLPNYRSSFRTIYFEAFRKSILTGKINHYTLALAGIRLHKKGLAQELQGLPTRAPDFMSQAQSAGMAYPSGDFLGR